MLTLSPKQKFENYVEDGTITEYIQGWGWSKELSLTVQVV